MGQRIGENLRQKLTMADSGLDGLKAKIDANAAHAEQDVQSHLDRVRKRIEQGRAKVSAAQADVKSWVDEQKAITSDKIAEWKAKREIGSCRAVPTRPTATPRRQLTWRSPHRRGRASFARSMDGPLRHRLRSGMQTA
jgi:hypothetical protein